MGCFLGLCGCHLGCVDVQLDLRTFPLFAVGLAFSAAYFGVVMEVVLWAVGSVGRKVGMVWFSGGVFLCFSGDSEGRVLVFLGGVCDSLCFCAEGVIFGRGVTLGVTERGYTFGGRGVTKLGAGGGWLMGGDVPFWGGWI